MRVERRRAVRLEGNACRSAAGMRLEVPRAAGRAEVSEAAELSERARGCSLVFQVKPDRRFAVNRIVLSPWVDSADNLVGYRDDRAWYGGKSRNVAFFC